MRVPRFSLRLNKTVGEIAADFPVAMDVFKEIGIDFCCGGKLPLVPSLTEKNVTLGEFIKLLTEALEQRKGQQSVDFKQMSPGVLSSYIEDTHHDYLRKALPRAAELLAAVLRAHGKNHRELYEVFRLFGQLKTDLEQHLVKEETLLFPALSQNSTPDAETAQTAADIIAEHEAAGRLLDDLRLAAHDYTAPSDACTTYTKVYQLLPEIEEDLHRHIHLENNILLKGLDPRP